MEYLLFGIYLLLFTWITTEINFIKDSQLSTPKIAALFLIKVAVGVLYGWIAFKQRKGAAILDTWWLHQESLKETHSLLTNPFGYISSFFYNPYATDFGSLFASKNSYFNNLKDNVYIRTESIFNCFSFGNYFINIIFYSFITFFGAIAIYKVMRHYLHTNNTLVVIGCFLIPSFLYWCSGMHKDGLAFTAVSSMVYIIYYRHQKQPISIKRTCVLLLSIILLFALRNYILLLLLPAVFSWLIAERVPKKSLFIYIIVYGLGCILFFNLKTIVPSIDLPAYVVNKQEAFTGAVGNTSLQITILKPNISRFIKGLPQAIYLGCFSPFISDVKSPLLALAFVEIFVIWILLLIYAFIGLPVRSFHPFGLFIFFFCFSILLLIGYTVNNIWAIARYRAIIFPFIMPLILMGIKRNEIIKKLNIKNK